MIQCFGLTRRYGRFTAVNAVDLRIADGEVFGFLGLNGAGKTTVMRMICGLLRPTAGYSSIGGVDVRGPRDTQRLIPDLSFVSQEMRFHERSFLRNLLSIHAILSGMPVDSGLAFARLAGVPLDRPCARLSPGQQRKAQLAIAMLKRPRYLLLDEPTAGLDPQGVSEVRDLIRHLHDSGATVFLSSHILGEVQSICTSIGILHKGRLCYRGRIAESRDHAGAIDLEKLFQKTIEHEERTTP
jgi:ABC-2 type transport system ATP-binding protein